MHSKSTPTVIFLCLTFALSAARATTPTTTGDAEFLHEPPDDVRTGRLEDNSRAVIFAEQTDFVTDGPLKVDVSRPGEVVKLENKVGKRGKVKRGKKKTLKLSPSVIPAGKRVSSYYIHFDPVGKAAAELDATGSITFDEEVIGIIITGEKLVASNDIVGLSTTQYPGGQAQAAELTKGTRLTLSADKRTVSFTLRASNSADNIRAITMAQGEPARKQRPRSPGDSDDEIAAPDLLTAPSIWSGQRTITNRGKVFNCQVRVAARNGNVYTIVFTEHHSSIRLTMNFRLKGRKLILVGWKNNSIADWTIQNVQAEGSTDGQGMQIGYSWVQSGKGYQNALVQGSIDVTRDR